MICKHCLLELEPDDPAELCPKCGQVACRYCRSWRERTGYCHVSKPMRKPGRRIRYQQRTFTEPEEPTETRAFIEAAEILLGTGEVGDG